MNRRRYATTSTEATADAAHAAARRRMVGEQLEARGIRDPCVLAAMAEIPRERFVPPALADRAYDDCALPIGEGQTISQPYMVAAMVALLELRGTERVLEVGTGSGYAAGVLSRCAREVVTVERHPGLAGRAHDTLAALGFDNVEARAGDGTRGAPDRAPFEAVAVAAAAEGEPPAALFDQLVPGGVLVCPVRRDGDERLVRWVEDREETLGAVRFVPLVTGPPGA
jgi:protein-L-isoaspartate(D-aspartate) O-methyltransferase